MPKAFTALLPALCRCTFYPLILATGLLTGCERDSSPVYQPQYSESAPDKDPLYLFGVHPLHNPNRLYLTFGPLVDYLNQHIGGVRFKLEASRNYAAYDKKLYAGRFHFALPNPYQTVNSLQHNYHVFGKMADDHNFRGIILARKDKNIRHVGQLKGNAISFPAPTALAATMMPQFYLQTNGLNVTEEIDIRYVGSQESSIMNVYLGNTLAGATWPPPWRAISKERPELAQELEIVWRTEPLPNNGLVVRNDIAPEIVDQVADLLFKLHTDEQGAKILDEIELSKFEPASDTTYKPVVEFLDKFNAQVRPIK
ncbi:MAG: phosphate/phosphite/phosphonate ABC transporter substrate-binding protein [Thiohalophilus sp.]|uniref:phosphate/phosphite/phosphonate ABC transporter substrate-binding protein n=1 Tax=Thiohalophilus sp. TaxID=3028392 RepID=UPI002870507A|nr:phosphate/phosphite/phosphonate ABC transporter substrate-binding protein [Thiohalophilus sp.]MDR9435265.1 phosphate/phosphite/phosphonate ABC transporter substrate-binding protein [Thiohalophilus sp.]